MAETPDERQLWTEADLAFLKPSAADLAVFDKRLSQKTASNDGGNRQAARQFDHIEQQNKKLEVSLVEMQEKLKKKESELAETQARLNEQKKKLEEAVAARANQPAPVAAAETPVGVGSAPAAAVRRGVDRTPVVLDEVVLDEQAKPSEEIYRKTLGDD